VVHYIVAVVVVSVTWYLCICTKTQWDLD